MKIKFALFSLFIATFSGYAATESKASTEIPVDRSAPDFIRVSLMIADPDTDLCSYLGHAFLRLECPTYKLDRCFTYESESIKEHPLRFLAGKLRMGMYSSLSEPYLDGFRQQNRGVRQYALDLPPMAKQRLWRILDEKVAEGIEVPYDPLEKSCAVTILRVIAKACRPDKLAIHHWPYKADATMREIVRDHSIGYDWYRVFLCAIFGTAFDKTLPPFEKAIVPSDLLSVLKSSSLNGQPIISDSPVQLFPSGQPHTPSLITPMMVSIGLLALSLASWFYCSKLIVRGFLIGETLFGICVVFLVVGSMLPLNPWNWLIIPFNILPAVFWKWRRYWAGCYAVVLLVWNGFMIFYPHQLTDWSYCVLTFALISIYTNIACHAKRQ